VRTTDKSVKTVIMLKLKYACDSGWDYCCVGFSQASNTQQSVKYKLLNSINTELENDFITEVLRVYKGCNVPHTNHEYIVCVIASLWWFHCSRNVSNAYKKWKNSSSNKAFKYSKLKCLRLLDCFGLSWTNHLQLTIRVPFLSLFIWNTIRVAIYIAILCLHGYTEKIKHAFFCFVSITNFHCVNG